MENIYRHIEALLANHDYVILSGIGGFVIQNQSASIKNGIITAPSSTITFNPLMQHSDGLLAIEIARSEGLTYRKAVELLQKEIEFINESLDRVRYFNFGTLGLIEKNEKNELIFTPPTNTSFIPANLGLKDIQLPTNKKQSKESDRKISFTFPKARTFRYAAAAVLLFLMLLISPSVNDQKHAMNADLFSISFTTEKAINSIEEIPEAVETIEPVTENNSTELTETTSENIEVIDNNKNSFHVIVASLVSKLAAQNYCQSLLDKQFTNAYVLDPIRTYRVAIESFDNRKEAIKYMQNLRKSDTRFEQAWVLCE